MRFYPNLADLADTTNPQNIQVFGENLGYPLEVNDFHRFLIPNFKNEVADSELLIWCVNADEEYQLVSVCEIGLGLLKYVTFKSKRNITGRLEIRNSEGIALFFSNCVQFLDSTDQLGRKHIRIATKHNYNRNLFDYENPFNWIITSVPAYCHGMTDVETDISNSRTGGNSSLRVRETYIDEIVTYQFLARGDSNILNFLQVHATNKDFFIDGTQRTCLDRIERDEFSISGKVKFTNVKNEKGLNVQLDYSDKLNDIFVFVLGDNSETIIYSDNNNALIGV